MIFPRARPINIWDYRSLERLGKIFHRDFNHDYREKYSSSSEHPKIFMLEVMQIQVAPIAVVRSYVRIPRILYQISDSLRNHISGQCIRLNLYLRLNKIRIGHFVDICHQRWVSTNQNSFKMD
jgi:hypothetical protein